MTSSSSHKLIKQIDNPLYALLLQGIKFYKWIEWILIYIFQGPVFWYMNKSYEKGDIIIGGNRSWDIKLQPRHRKEFYHRLANNASLGLGETYMEGFWECDDICELSYRIFSHKVYTDYLHPINRAVNYLMFHVFNLQTKARAWRVAEEHYDIGNDLFESFLDPTMNYSCGYWANGCDNLNEAQINKMDLIAKKLKLKPGMKVLDIGCGWGGLCKHLAEKYKVECVGITISKEGAAIGQERCANLPVDIRLMDYRDLNEQFDRVVSVGMFEHVGRSNYKEFFNIVRSNLKDDGIFLLHTIGVGHRCVPEIEPWFHKYIFPNGVLPRDDIITKDIQDLFIIEDWHNFSNDYSKTLIAWHQNFIKSWPKRTHPKGTRFYRMWTYYLLMCAGAFKSRKYQLWQIVLSKDGLIGGYESVR